MKSIVSRIQIEQKIRIFSISLVGTKVPGEKKTMLAKLRLNNCDIHLKQKI
jgi:hypothetical protein